jgi:putative salt-induced outer membrane protein YdiY
MNMINMSRSSRGALLAVVWGCLGTGDALAEPKPAAAEPPKGWVTTAAAAITLTRGNSETFLGTLSIDTVRKWEKDEVVLGASGAYGESDDLVNQESVQGYGQYNRLFNEKLYMGLRLDGQYDGIAGVDYRFRISPMVGYYLVKTPKISLALEAGPSAVFEQLKGRDQETYLGARFGERFEYQLTATTKIWQSCEYIPRVDDWVNSYLINNEVGIDTAINKHWSLRVVFQDFYNSLPAVGRKENDLRLMAGTAYKF